MAAPAGEPEVPAAVLVCPDELGDEVGADPADVVALVPAAPELEAAVVVCPDEPGDVTGVDPAEVVAVVPVDPAVETAWPVVVPPPGVVDEVEEVVVGALVAVLVLDCAEGGGDVCVVAVLVVVPVAADPDVVVAVDWRSSRRRGLCSRMCSKNSAYWMFPR